MTTTWQDNAAAFAWTRETWLTAMENVERAEREAAETAILDDLEASLPLVRGLHVSLAIGFIRYAAQRLEAL